MLQLNPPLPMLTPQGEGMAHFLIDYGPESDLYWTVFITETGEVWTFSNRNVRASKNITLGRTRVEPLVWNLNDGPAGVPAAKPCSLGNMAAAPEGKAHSIERQLSVEASS